MPTVHRQTAALACFVVGLALPARAPAQTSPFLPDARLRALVNEISGDRAYEHVRQLSHYHRTGGSRDFCAGGRVPAGRGRGGRPRGREARPAEVGRERLVVPPRRGVARSTREPSKLADYGEVAVSIADNSRTTHVTAELVDVGAGVSEKPTTQGREVEGHASCSPRARVATVVREAVWKRGALGVVSSMTNRPEAIDAPDQVAWGHVPYEAKGVEGVKDGTPGGFAVMVSPRRGLLLQKQLAAAAAPLRVKVDIESELPREAGAGHGRGLDPRQRDPRPAGRADRPHPGGDDLGQRRRQRLRQRARDRPGARPARSRTARCRGRAATSASGG